MSIISEEFILCFISVFVFACLFVYLRKKKPYQAASNHWFIICSIGLFISIIYSVDKYVHFFNRDTWNGIADNILSGALFSVLCFVFLRYERFIKNKYEDREKLTISYKDLVNKYYKDRLLTVTNKDKNKVVYPIINLGTGFVSLNDSSCGEIIINDCMDDQYKLPIIIENNFSKIFKSHDTSNVFNSLNIRAKNMTFKDNILTFDTGRTTYYDSLVTNRAADFAFEDGLSVRTLFEMGPKMSKLELSKLSNHLGFNGFLQSSDGYIVFVKRSEKMSIGKGTYGDSIGASLKATYALDENGVFTIDKLRNAVIKEIEAELKIAEEELVMESLGIIAIYRDCVECGKPQFLICAKSNKTACEITKRFMEKRGKNYQKNDSQLQLLKIQSNLDIIEDGSELVWISKECLKNNIIYTSYGIEYDNEGKEGFVTFVNERKKVSKVQKMNMVPSASASVRLFANTINFPKIKESYIKAKNDCIKDCEDGIYIGEDIIAVIDGATSKSNFLWEEKSSGLFAKDIICKALSGEISKDNPKVFFETINNFIKNEIAKRPECKKRDWPRASIIAYIPSKEEVWSYGDCRCKIGTNKPFLHKKIIDVKLANKRSKIIEKELESGKNIDDLLKNDFGRNSIEKDLLAQFNYENVHCYIEGEDFGYPVINGEKICENMICIYKVQTGQDVVLATDGYPYLECSLEESENKLLYLLENDPLCYKEYKSTKGLKIGSKSFDDRAYIRFEI